MEDRRNVLSPSRSLACVLITLSGAGCAALEDHLRYSHALHVERDTSCLSCHAGIDESDRLEQSFIPNHRGCQSGCHDTHNTRDEERCNTCHTEPARAKRSGGSTRGLIFSHQRHMEPARGNCMKCHLEIPDAKTAEESKVPEMEVCTESCHQPMMEALQCDRCHTDLSRYPIESVRFFSHGPSFVQRHGIVARSTDETCAQCHERTFCADCHSGTRIAPASTQLVERSTRGFIHPAPYASIHAIDAKVTSDRCLTCHRPSFCDSCHSRALVGALDALRSDVHPNGWLDPTSVDFHGVEARRSIASCAACHDQGAASVCVRCHQVGGTGGSPHPIGFSPRADVEKNRMCRACHW